MNGLPEPFTPGVDRVVYHGKQYMVTVRHPNADSWQYIGVPCDLIGPEVHFLHHEVEFVGAVAGPPIRRTPGLVIEEPEPVEPTRIGETDPEKNLIEALASWARGGLSSADLRATYLMFKEGTTA